jgi:hypothetical protein
MVNWSAKVHGKALTDLFEKGSSDPTATKASEIDPFKRLAKCFDDIDKKRWRDNYRKTAATYTRSKGLQGVRRAGEILVQFYFSCLQFCFCPLSLKHSLILDCAV